MPELFHRKIERSAIGFLLAIIAAASVGGIVDRGADAVIGGAAAEIAVHREIDRLVVRTWDRA